MKKIIFLLAILVSVMSQAQTIHTSAKYKASNDLEHWDRLNSIDYTWNMYSDAITKTDTFGNITTYRAIEVQTKEGLDLYILKEDEKYVIIKQGYNKVQIILLDSKNPESSTMYTNSKQSRIR